MSDTLDVFPLKPGLKYDYLYYHLEQEYDMISYSGGYLDSGYVHFHIIDSTAIGDTVISWNIEQQRYFYHHATYIYTRIDTIYIIKDTTIFTIQENKNGMHQLITPIFTNGLWDFSSMDSIKRFSLSSNKIVQKRWNNSLPYSSSGIDSLWFSDSSGFYRMRTNSTINLGSQSWINHYLSFTLINKPTMSVKEQRSELAPTYFSLFHNYPNPFNPVTIISYELQRPSYVDVIVDDILGRRVALLAAQVESAGKHSIVFDGSQFSSGIYFYRLVVDGRSQTKKMNLVK
jgi:hypothetical protein